MTAVDQAEFPRVSDLTWHVLNVSARTNWSFIALHTSDGQTHWGEASLNGWEPMQQGAVALLRDSIVGQRLDQVMALLAVSPLSPGGLVYASVISALAQALLSWKACHQESTWQAPLGSVGRQTIRAYANINRATKTRTPDGFVSLAKQAIAQGFTAFKAAPFDDLTPALCSTAVGRQRLHHGITCMLALRDAIGPQARLMIDCHWRLDEAHAEQLLKDLAPAALHWFECPLPETQLHMPALKRLRQLANDQGVLTAGAETMIGVQGFQPLFDAGTYDVVMPDVKYCGGPWVMLQIAQRAQEAGVLFSPHNPSGPLASLHSLNVASVAPECDMIELQFQESPMFEALMPEQHPMLIDGAFAPSTITSMQLQMNMDLIEAHPYQFVPSGVENLAMGLPDKVVS